MSKKLTVHGGARAVTKASDILKWPLFDESDENAVLSIMRGAGSISGTNITLEFEKELSAYFETDFALCYVNGTASLHAAMWACGVGIGDEIICPSMVYWAACTPALSLGATVNFADIDRHTLCIDPNDIEHRIGPRTKAIIAVHACSYPCDMDAIMAIGRKHNVKVIEDVSHAQGGLYKGRKCGSIGDAAGVSMMSGKSLVSGEAGVLLTSDPKIFERALCFSHYERVARSNYNNPSYELKDEYLKRVCGLPFGGFKYRLNQLCSALGRSQLKKYPARVEEISKAMNYFWDSLEGLPGLKAHRPPKDSGSTNGAWYAAQGLYFPDELGGLSNDKFAAAVCAEGSFCSPFMQPLLHLHPLFNEVDVYGTGRPSVVAFAERDVRQGVGSLPVSEKIKGLRVAVPWFKYYDKEVIDQHVHAYRKVIENYKQLL